MAFLQNRAVAAAGILGLLVLLSLGSDPGGYLGTDTGGKTATLQAMVDRGDWSPDVGYWAEEWDPTGRYHPLFATERTDEGWIQVTSLPMVLAARPLYDVGGYRAALLLPMAGTVLAALAAGALVRRIADEGSATLATWVTGLGSPLVVYGLDLWEHSLGVAAIGWACVVLVDVSSGVRHPAVGGLAGGALLGSAAAMRTEALVYALVLVGGVCAWVMVRRRLAAAVVTGSAAVVGLGAVWGLNGVLEGVLGSQSRTERATGAAAGASEAVSGSTSEWATRLEEGLRTTFAVSANSSWRPVVLGVALVIAVVAAVVHGGRLTRERQRLVAVALTSFTLLTVLPGLGFVPGLFAAFPVAAAALALGRVMPLGRVLVAVAVSALPVVWAFQFIGGAGPQWAGRYVLPSTLLLGAVGFAALGHPNVARPVATAVVLMSVAVNAFGVVWLWERSHEITGLFDRIERDQGPALIARNTFLLREAGPRVLGERWLSAPRDRTIDGPVEVVRKAGLRGFSVLQSEGDPAPAVPGTTTIGVDTLDVLGVTFELVHLRFE